ncbi:hypothetical protein [Dinoroseobacter sp. S76]|uniref:hypothetical protein n=1 Tax=Dinoroseobacter sp. S76 TaxID=3415124 RepID=UPI003C7CEE9F
MTPVWLTNGGYALGFSLNGVAMVQFFDSSGSPQTPAVPVLTGRGSTVEEMVALPTGGLIAVVANQEGQAYGQVVNTDGSLTGGPFPTAIGRDPEMVILEGLNHVVVASAGGDDAFDDVYLRVMEPNSVIINDLDRVNTEVRNTQNEHSVAALSDGGFIVVYASKTVSGAPRGIVAQEFDSVGNKVGAEFEISPVDSFDANDRFPQVAALPDGGYVVTWMRFAGEVLNGANSDFDVYYQMFDVDNQPVTGQILAHEGLANTSNYQPVIASFPDGQFAIAWIDFAYSRVPDPETGGMTTQIKESVKVQLFNADGQAVGAPQSFGVDNFKTDSVQNLEMAASETGDLLVTWREWARGADYKNYGALLDVTVTPPDEDGTPEPKDPLLQAVFDFSDPTAAHLFATVEEEGMVTDPGGVFLDLEITDAPRPGATLNFADRFIFDTTGEDLCLYFGDGDDATADLTYLVEATDDEGLTAEVEVGISLPSLDQAQAEVSFAIDELLVQREQIETDQARVEINEALIELNRTIIDASQWLIVWNEVNLITKIALGLGGVPGAIGSVIVAGYEYVDKVRAGDVQTLDAIRDVSSTFLSIVDALKSFDFVQVPVLTESLGQKLGALGIALEFQTFTRNDAEIRAEGVRAARENGELLVENWVLENVTYAEGFDAALLEVDQSVQAHEDLAGWLEACAAPAMIEAVG